MPNFDAAIAAIDAGDAAGLARLLDAEPALLRERITAPDGHRTGYFRDPKLVWHIANNPRRIERMPENIGAVARVLIERGIERADLDTTLELVMTSASARLDGHQGELVRMLRDAGASVTPSAVIAAAAHRERAILRTLFDGGDPQTLPLAAALGDANVLSVLLEDASQDQIQLAFALAVINEELACTRLALDAGADVNAYFPADVHPHATALHQAAANDDAAMIALLLERGARPDQRDMLWDGTPLDWAIHEHKAAAGAALAHASTSSA